MEGEGEKRPPNQKTPIFDPNIKPDTRKALKGIPSLNVRLVYKKNGELVYKEDRELILGSEVGKCPQNWIDSPLPLSVRLRPENFRAVQIFSEV